MPPLRLGPGRERAAAFVFRDLCDELGYVLEGHGVKLAPQGKRCSIR